MRTTRYIWINNLPPSVTEENVRSVLAGYWYSQHPIGCSFYLIFSCLYILVFKLWLILFIIVIWRIRNFSFGKIQTVKIYEDEHGAVVAFVDTKSASRAIDHPVKLSKIYLKLQFCESSGVPYINPAQKLGAVTKSDQRSTSPSDSKSLAGEIDTDSTTTTPYSSRSSSPQNAFSGKATLK